MTVTGVLCFVVDCRFLNNNNYIIVLFCAGTLAGLGLSWIYKYATKTTSRWQQVVFFLFASE